MQFRQKYNNLLTGVAGGLIIPVFGFMVFFLLTRHGISLAEYIRKVKELGNLSEILSVSVFANIVIFLIFNKFDMLMASRGVLGITILWAFAVFALKLF